MLKKLFTIGMLVSVSVCTLTAEAQETGDAPKPAMAGDNSAALQVSGTQDVPDTRPPAGAQDLSLGTHTSHSFLLPSFGVITQAQANPNAFGQTNAPAWISMSFISGRIGVNKISGRSELLLDYLAGGGFSSYSNEGNSVIQSLDVSETLHWGRWSQMFGDQFTDLPASSFGFGGFGGLNSFGVPLGAVGLAPGFRQDILPNQSIMTNGARRISNTAIAQTTYALGYRSSLSFVGAYSQLHFLDGGLQDSNGASFRGGYNYLLSPKNSMSVSYGFGRLRLSNSPQGIDDHNVQASFARRITGRLAFQVGAGPDIQIVRGPIAGPSTIVTWVASAGLIGGNQFQFRHMQVGLNYSHFLNGGSGILAGAQTDMVSGQLSRTLGRWGIGAFVGYSRNESLQQTILNANRISPQGWFAGAQASRHFARYGSLFFSYNASKQSSLAAVCSLPACRTNGLIQTISIGYNWGLRPIVLE
ncbi:MAG TPA: hypothetical protein VN943_14025 [Candidatus Acidoferrum sp.]|nr:hypothetical protein [Candidatus Acidoferrum sp.]